MQIKICRQSDNSVGQTVTHYFPDEMFSMLCFIFAWLCFILMGRLQGWRGGGNEWDWGKESIKSLKNPGLKKNKKLRLK